ncbi:MAG: hypothetical protein JSR41_04225 [Proteobacteria bacterium]|nr:hypothetical protein [Pseudomonadota bacterium]
MKVLSNWRSVRLWETQLERDLHRRYSLRTHGVLIGSATLLLMWAISAVQLRLGVESLALRYFVTLGAGYTLYLLVLRWWAQRLVEDRADIDPDAGDLAEVADLAGNFVPSYQAPLRAGARLAGEGSSSASGSGVGDAASGVLDALSGADEGAVVVVPVVAIFLIGAAVVTGAGALALLYFGWDALLAVAIEVAFSYVAARAAVRVTREGWLTAAVRLTWKPLLGALLCAVLLGWSIDHFIPQANSLPDAVRALLKR